MASKRTVYSNGAVAEPFRPKTPDGLGVWFYAARGTFDFVVQDSENGKWRQTIQFKIPTRMLRDALKLTEKGKTDGEQAEAG